MTINDPTNSTGEKGKRLSHRFWRPLRKTLNVALSICGMLRLADSQTEQQRDPTVTPEEVPVVGSRHLNVIMVGSKWWKGSRLIAAEQRHTRQAVGLAVAATAAVVVSVTSLVAFEKSAASAVTTMETGANESKTQILPDGTNVWLGAESKLWVDFRGAMRRVYLQGQATMDVAQNVKPFMMATYLTDATTMDGKFSAAVGETDMKLTIHRGTVALSTKQGTPVIALKEGQRYQFISEPPRTARADSTAGREKGPAEG